MAPQEPRTVDREEQFQAVLADYLKAVEAGQPADPGPWQARHPEFAAELAEFFAARAAVNRVALPLRAVAVNDPTPLPGEAFAARDFGDYTLLMPLAQGGMGVVYKARQHSLNRVVALKLILSGP